ncbi:hypothetical protein Tco_1021915, partial [Tanacetum coccineum]
FPVIHQPLQEMSIQDVEDLKQQYLDEMKTLINEKDYHSGRIDIEIKINELKENFNEMSIEINKKKKLILRDISTLFATTMMMTGNILLKSHQRSPLTLS